MARMVLRSCAVSIALALVGTLVCAQTPQSIYHSAQTARTFAQRNRRIVSLLEQLADQARASEDLPFAVRAQSQAATTLWSQDAEQARAIYRRAFQSLSGGASSKLSNNVDRPDSTTPGESARAVSATQRGQLRSELLNQIAAHDPQLAEELARGPGNSTEGFIPECVDRSSTNCNSSDDNVSSAFVAQASAPARADTERQELLMSAAMQVVEHDPQQAMAFAQMSVALGISPNLARFLTLLQSVDAERADLLFANAMARLEQSARVDLTEVHTLGAYVVSVVNSPAKQLLSRTLVMQFLNFAFDQIARGSETPSAITSPEESAAFYFVGRQLTDLFGRYLPARMAVLQRYLIDRSDAGTYVQVEPTEIKTRAPGDVAGDASEATDAAERDSLYARAAMGWLARGEVKDAQAAALKISGDETRDRVLAQIVRRQSSEQRTEDGVALARRIVGVTTRVDVLVMLSTVALASNDSPLAFELLNEAETSLLKASPSIERARSLVRIANSFLGVDTIRGFEALQLAVKSINELTAEQRNSADGLATPKRTGPTQMFTPDELYAASFEGTLVALAKTDFDRALSLAQELAGRETSVIAQLAVCRGGLVEKAPVERSGTDDEAEWTLNH
jgi:hypothetical protein